MQKKLLRWQRNAKTKQPRLTTLLPFFLFYCTLMSRLNDGAVLNLWQKVGVWSGLLLFSLSWLKIETSEYCHIPFFIILSYYCELWGHYAATSNCYFKLYQNYERFHMQVKDLFPHSSTVMLQSGFSFRIFESLFKIGPFRFVICGSHVVLKDCT